jgi:glutamate 5-kinase
MKITVIKVGSALLRDGRGALNREVLEQLAGSVHALIAAQRHPVVVSSGAVTLGAQAFADRQAGLERKQAAAAVGQALLMARYREVLVPLGHQPAQILLTHADLSDRGRYLQACQTLRHLLEHGLVPIINENDSVSDDELRVGDNDRLAVEVARLLEAERLILMTTHDGVFDRDPSVEPGAKRLRRLEVIDDRRIEAAIGRSSVGTGGMRSKLKQARRAQASGIAVSIASGLIPANWTALAAGDPIGTEIPPAERRQSARQTWIAETLRPAAELAVDRGCAEALRLRGASLLAPGITATDTAYRRGDCVSVTDGVGGPTIARGLVRLDKDQVDKALSAGVSGCIVIHRGDLVRTDRGRTIVD